MKDSGVSLMKDRQRIVVDTNALVSRLLLPASIPGQAVDKAVDEAQLLISTATLEELADVLARAKFDPYITVNDQWRICFAWRNGEAWDVEIDDYH